MLWSIGLQRVVHDLATELKQQGLGKNLETTFTQNADKFEEKTLDKFQHSMEDNEETKQNSELENRSTEVRRWKMVE